MHVYTCRCMPGPHCTCGGQRTSHRCLFSPFMWNPKRIELRSSGFAAANTFNYRAIPQPANGMSLSVSPPPKHSQPAEWRDPNTASLTVATTVSLVGAYQDIQLDFQLWGNSHLHLLAKLVILHIQKALNFCPWIKERRQHLLLSHLHPVQAAAEKAGKSRQLVVLILLITGELESSENKT